MLFSPLLHADSKQGLNLLHVLKHKQLAFLLQQYASLNNNSHGTTPGAHSLALLCTAAVRTRTPNNVSTQSGLSNLVRQHVRGSEQLLIQLTLLFPLQEQAGLSGPYLAHCSRFDISTHHRCPGTENKTFPTTVSSGSGFLTHGQTDGATDLEATPSSLRFLTHNTQPEFDLSSLSGYSFLAHLIVLLLLINLVLGL